MVDTVQCRFPIEDVGGKARIIKSGVSVPPEALFNILYNVKWDVSGKGLEFRLKNINWRHRIVDSMCGGSQLKHIISVGQVSKVKFDKVLSNI